jgi:DNA polymerase (family 10)
MHTDWSDGLNTVQEMVNGAKDLGYHYLAITDHSRSSAIANGLSTERLKAQIDTVKVITSKTEGITVLTGSEVDILKDGRLDFADELLAELDVVIASVHSVFEMSQVQMTKRIIRAIENPFTMMIGHPTGRLLGSRPGYAVDLSAVIDAAADHGVALEINASPYRLDLESDAVMEAKSKGVMLSVNTDAHAVSNLNQMPLGITIARRGWLESANLINTLSLDDFRRWKNRCQKL